MQIKNAEFFRSMNREYFNDGLPEIAFVGRSNVGKSSLINMLANHSRLARVSQQPGKTRLINYFLVNRAFYLVDLPGYGFARASKAEKQSWDGMMANYFEKAAHLKAVVMLVDIRHAPTEEDQAMMAFAEYHCIPYIVCATKADKIAKSKRYNECMRLKRQLRSSFDYTVIPVSSQNGYGKEQLLEEMARFLPAGPVPGEAKP